jgi:hypothetical protein
MRWLAGRPTHTKDRSRSSKGRFTVKISLVFRITGAAVGIQLAVGGLVTFGYIGAGVHILLGVIVGILAVVALACALRMKPRVRPLVGLSTGIGVDVLLQAILGFGVIGTTSDGSLTTALAYVHFLNALGNLRNGAACEHNGHED